MKLYPFYTISLLFSLSFDLCQGDGVNLVGTTVTRTNVSLLAAITADLRDMANHCDQGQSDEAREIYRNGKHATYSLQHLATDENNVSNDITFAFQMYGLTNGIVENMNDDNSKFFAAKYVEELFDNNQCILAVHASKHIILWMHVALKSWKIIRDCRIKSDPYYDNNFNNVENMIEKPDEMIAYWVGAIQDTVEGTSGHSLYSDTNLVGEFFGTKKVGSGAFANWNILHAYESLSGILSSDGSCSQYSNSIEAMWPLVVQLLSQMMIPQIQSLVMYMLKEDIEMVNIHSRVVVPQLSQCRHSDYEYLKEAFIENVYNPEKFHSILEVLQRSYSCFGLNCENIGTPISSSDNALTCNKYYDKVPNLAGYPATSEVADQSKIDLDIHQINILTQFDSIEYWEMAKYIYLYGKNSMIVDYYVDDDDLAFARYRSLHSFAISGKRKDVIFYSEYAAYFDDPNYADTTILSAFDDEGRYSGRSLKQRAAVIGVALQAQLMYMAVLAELEESVQQCGQNNDITRAADSWDEVAAYIIGSLEGEERGGSSYFSDGELLWSLGNNRCIEFGRQNSDHFAYSNAEILELLLAGKGQILSSNCQHLGRTANDIAHMLLVPIVQSVIKYAIALEFETFTSPDPDVALGETFANALIPVLIKYNERSAMKVKRNMVAEGGSSFGDLVTDGPQAVADTYLSVSDDFNIDCSYIGKKFEVDACLHYTLPEVSSQAWSRSMLATFAVGALSLLGSLMLI